MARLCTTPGCGNPATSGKCAACRARSRRQVDGARPSAASRGYGADHRDRFRAGVLARDPACVLCGKPSTVADHWPASRRELVEAGADPDDPRHGRGLCKTCHDQQTAANQPGGFAQRRRRDR